MGQDKALLPFDGAPLAHHIATVVETACGSAVIVGDPSKHAAIGRPVITDLHPSIGPLGGIEAALAASNTPWVLVTACDMPAITPAFLRQLTDEAGTLESLGQQPDAILPIAPGNPVNPLCALYHQRILPHIRQAIATGDYKITRALNGTNLALLPVDDGAPLRNANTPAEWDALLLNLTAERRKADALTREQH